MMNVTRSDHLQSQNEARGFWGAVRHHADQAEAWRLALEGITAATGCPGTAVRGFLDSRYGRLFADEARGALSSGSDLPHAIDHAVACWMEKRIDGRTEDELGIPAGLPRLTGFVLMHEALRQLGPNAALAEDPRHRHPATL